jgi:co-chaperonin GroES (HSP10)
MLIPVGHRVIVRPKEVEKVSDGGIILTASTYEEKLEKAGICEGELVAIGPTAWRDFDKWAGPGQSWYKWAKIGDYVWYSQYGGKLVQDPHTEEEFVIMNDEDILMIIKDDKEFSNG